MKNPLTQAGIEPTTLRFVAQHLNHCATTVSIVLRTVVKIYPSVGTYCRKVPPECILFTRLHEIALQKVEILIVAAVRTFKSCTILPHCSVSHFRQPQS